jgi:acyl-CoA synthetase (AMP-forming)/AMP-acid ligase II
MLKPTAAHPDHIRRWYEEGLFYGHETVSQAMTRGAAAHGDSRVIFQSTTRPGQTTLAAMHEGTLAVASALYALGLRQGDVIAVQAPNWLEGLQVIQAAMHIGAVVAPIIHIYGPKEVGFILRSSGARMFVMPDRWRNIDYLERLSRTDLAGVETVVTLGETAPAGGITWPQLMARQGADFPRTTARPDDICAMIYTSGSTSDPKGVLHSHNSLLATDRTYALMDGRDRSMVTLAPWPAGHIGSFLNVLRVYLTGASTVLMDSWDADAAVQLIQQYGVTQTQGTPYFVSTLLDAAEAHGVQLTSIMRYLVGGASVPPQVVIRANQHGIPAGRCYGSSEGGTIVANAPTDPLEKRVNTEGRPVPGVQLKILGEDGAELPTGEEGEVTVLSPQMFLGYNDAALNAEAFTPDGWFKTGDVGRMDGDGYLTLTDRKKDIIIRGGENISSKEVEDVLATHPAVFESAVTAMPDEVMGEKVCAFVILRPGAELTLDAVRAHFVAAGVARQKTPERIVLVEDFPRTSAGKVKKFELRAQLRAPQCA